VEDRQAALLAVLAAVLDVSPGTLVDEPGQEPA
jgi:hypothetical protein